MEEEGYEDRPEVDCGTCGEEGEEDCENESRSQSWPAEVSTLSFCSAQEAECVGKVGVKAERGEAVAGAACERGLLACQGENAATTSDVGDETCVNCGGTDERIAAVNCVFDECVFESGLFLCWTSDENRCVANVLISNGVVARGDVLVAVGGTSEGESGIGKGATLVAVNTAFIAFTPVAGSAAQTDGIAIAWNFSCDRGFPEDEGKGEEPACI